MRVRNRKGAPEYMASHPEIVVTEPEIYKGKWHERFGNPNPIHIEVGSGKGRFITEMAKRHPEINYISIEIQLSVLSHVLDKALADEIPNLQLLQVDGSSLTNYFADDEIDLIYLNFSDPWPKKRHEKRRLTSSAFLEVFQKISKNQGALYFKTDNQVLFEYSLASFSQFGMKLKQVWLDLHSSDFEDNIMTEYEEKFSTKGQRIYRVEAQFPPK
ncbi:MULTISPECIES: tRNA (guanosine(46)-N7)-methyltransferase TrmB [unclassified Enterococcus]|uniref:tRNA (guanosine(46)-N7)-methyltransferase TrmB n=1 Tax=unclassified Enterococcus TaxID=2608891 RepID=UPI001553BA38|nr:MULTISPECIES: tRNA (guanosine(46)-N7)-methyltransferase TrmB [unclassified Enterococcus]MBS7576523.1 tRNA (guanosine(46)-N7)-methyltransferase TrmB [Enterococcus sp. MMGLQ5-2]MBS7583990.1 tRNA (guanosine(46)-N7)-methyltransferase TrmB [Enterococcus sp. MMGLQ5-1]NPD11851.1 tRNA (guanosine(46)-N7)-methyltransferase TrmB [Enterococcus sp. MMGLQ5-1]NPD36360.1 tRNA (guanosine(46)-N7)-methyltransferase TrmB [Enterococcus sp. MMGLQ5-2]